jgi:hypothetical protein
MTFESEMNQQRKAWLFEKGRNAYNDRRNTRRTGMLQELLKRMEQNSSAVRDIWPRVNTIGVFIPLLAMISEKRYRTDYSNKKHAGADKEESDGSYRGTPDNPQDDDGGDEYDDVGGNDEDGNGERPSFNPFLD